METLFESKLTLREEYELHFIPKIHLLLLQEEEHLSFLKKHDVEKYPMITRFISHSNDSINHLKERLKEYKEHAERL